MQGQREGTNSRVRKRGQRRNQVGIRKETREKVTKKKREGGVDLCNISFNAIML